LVQKYILTCTPCKKSLTSNLAKKYVSPVGIPLVDKVKGSEGSLEGRVQILENLLKDYYLDNYYLKEVKNVIDGHKKLHKEYRDKQKALNKQNEQSKECKICGFD